MTWKKRFGLSLFCLLILLVACWVTQYRLRGLWFDAFISVPVPAKLTLFSIDGTHGQGKVPSNGQEFHEYPVLGKLEINDAEQRRKVMAALERGMWTASRSAGCFWPRHGVRIEQDGEVRDYVICFQCSNVQIYTSSVGCVLKATTPDAKGFFNQLLVDASIPLAPEKP